MYFNVSYDFISLVVLLVLSVRFFGLKKFPVFSNLMYGILLILGIVNISLDIVGCYALSVCARIPIWLAYLPNVLYYIAQLVLSASLVLYLIALLGNKRPVKRSSYLSALIPFGIALSVFAVGMPLGQVFVISPEGGYEYGPLSLITYACVAVYLVLMFGILIANRHFFSKRDCFSVSVLGGFVILAVGIQKLFPQQLLSGSAIALGFLVMFFSIQDPRMMLDTDTGLFSVHAFTQLIDNGRFLKSEYYVAAFKLHGLREIYMLNGRETGDLALKMTGDYLSTFKSAWSFRTEATVFAVCFKSEAELKEFIGKTDSKRASSVLLGQVVLEPKHTMVIIDHDAEIKDAKTFLTVIGNAFDKKNIAGLQNKTTYLSKEQIDRYRRNIIIENEIRQDLKDGKRFQIEYQPIYSVSEGRFVSAEALVRYRSMTLGKLSPSEFVPMIESQGLAQELDRVVVKKVFTDIENGVFKDLSFQCLHINLSASTFSSGKSIENVIALAKKGHIDCTKIVFEITETATTLSNDTLEQYVGLLSEKGFKIALDDFGMGYANIGRLYQLPFSTVKLDKCLIDQSAAIFKDIAGIFKSFEVDIVAEGVETEDQVGLVTRAGVDLIQGYYYSHPLPPEELTRFIKEKKTDR